MSSSVASDTAGAIAIVTAALERGAAVRPRVGGFPYLAEALRAAGITRCTVHVLANTFVYRVGDGDGDGDADVAIQGEPLRTGTVEIAPFDEAALVAALRTDQAGESTFPEFLEATWRAGVLAYEVDLRDRTCTYRAADGRAYVERYAAVTL